MEGPRTLRAHIMILDVGANCSRRVVELTHYYRPAGVPREQQPWLASVWRKLAS